MPPDPATFYGGPGFEVQDALYDGLVQYAHDNTPKIVPDLASKWTISPDGKTYTFTLQSGAKFHDGSTVNSAAVKYSFERELKINSTPAYMLKPVASIATPNPQTVVITLKQPTEPFLNYLASFVGPKVLSPTTLKAHLGKDNGQTYLATHDAGSGPYVLTSLVANQGYRLDAFKGYWGPKPQISTINIKILPDVNSQILQLEQGDVDALTQGIPSQLLGQLKGNSSISLKSYPAVYKTLVYLNPTTPLLKNETARQALIQAIDRKTIVDSAYQDAGTLSTGLFPYGQIPASQAPDNPTYDPSKLTAIAKAAAGSSKHLTVGYLQGVPNDQRASELIQAELQATGLDVTTKSVSLSALYALYKNPASAPSVVVLSTNSDAADPYTWLHPYFNTGSTLNLLGASVPSADALDLQGTHSSSVATADGLYAQAAEAYVKSGYWMALADQTTVVASRSGWTFQHSLGDPFGIILADVRFTG
jgi:peptide/nickel transport system substrate-binding protein